MTRDTMEQMLKIDNENEARELAGKMLGEYRSDPNLPDTAEEWLGDMLRWVFGNEEMEMRRIAMWSKIAADLGVPKN